MLTCKEVTTMIGSDSLVRATWSTRMGVRLHLMMCRHCSRYSAQLRAIAAEARRAYSEFPNVSELEQSILTALGRE
ncbi:MAG: anti-sigma factor family protein [Thermoanaerobaculia bacterium]